MGNDLGKSFESLFGNLDNFISTKTVVGEPVHIGEVILVPLVDVTFGVGAGAFGKQETKGDNGAGGLGARITPSAMVVIMNGSVQLVNVKNQDSINKLIDMVPGLLSKLHLDSLFGNKNKEENEDGVTEKVVVEKEVTVTKVTKEETEESME